MFTRGYDPFCISLIYLGLQRIDKIMAERVGFDFPVRQTIDSVEDTSPISTRYYT
jgi:hypothetical protein